MRLIVITGTTATGKTELSIQLAKMIDGEIISADSMMVYRHMDIGTAKPTVEERQGIPHHLIDVVNPDEEFSAKDFLEIADRKIEEITQRGKIPIVVGGTWLYIHTLLYGLTDAPPSDWKLRENLYKRDKKELFSELENVDPLYASKIHPNDKKRVIRALEVYYLTGKPFSQYHLKHRFREKRYSFAGFILEREKEEIMERIEKRVETMFEKGLVEETKKLLEMGYEKAVTSKQAIGYKELIPYIKGETDLLSAKRQIIKNTKDFAKRQIRTFRSKLKGKDWQRITISNYTKDKLLDTIIKKINVEEKDEHTG
ncbi:tRNA (adenosine(37)-N6)-dimethylallyltransferase MiaA [Persephonella atlantica]|uniref:tRNA dimethylallyltransferase n=1 Tax=Persephonella atlantica TaxID=2699429 RepID=A0ABS1GJC0_9AQUI|nr:tRNA (adenosine(37)-N6)-dimethylallyltransferase MiaA [Persephonella atlantica]MBK3333029.1 tRNA (adenosine(37)-N6)-dimethylallyltransferase MiaA [Persephonella atlantica]